MPEFKSLPDNASHNFLFNSGWMGEAKVTSGKSAGNPLLTDDEFFSCWEFYVYCAAWK